MGKNVVNGLPARYNADVLVLTNGDALALQVDSTGALLTTEVAPGGSQPALINKLNGQPARYNENLITLQDGDATAIQTDLNGNTLISFA